MRITGGTHRSRRIDPPKNLPVRPTTDFAKESLFNILNNRINFETVHLLDLFSGTGNISFEFASRGTTHITAVDNNYNCIEFIKKNCSEFKFDFIKVVKSNAFAFLERENSGYDIIFADPPFSEDRTPLIPDIVFKNNLLKKNGLLIIEHSNDTDLTKKEHFLEVRKYGAVNFSIFKVKE